MRPHTRRFGLFLSLVLVATFVYLAAHGGRWLVVNEPQKSDVILVLSGDHNDRRYWTALALLRAGYGREVVIDENSDVLEYGRSPLELRADFISRTAPDLQSRIRICATPAQSTQAEAYPVARCLQALSARTVLLVTSDYHTRRALSIMRRRLPQYQWSAAAAADPSQFRPEWWRDREAAKTTLNEWLKTAWWYVVDRWRDPSHAS